jgi:predicted site-specific integrase-resolvase
VRIKLSDWAKQNGVTYRTAWNWFKAGKLPCKAIKTETDAILVEIEPENRIEAKTERIYVYARVSSAQKKEDLKSQAALCEQFCITNGWQVAKTFKEIASGMNDDRKMLNQILESPPDKLVVLYKDRLTRFGFNYLDKTLSKLGCKIVVINQNPDTQEDIVKDFIAVITSFCCRLYGARRGQAKALKIKKELQND